VIRQQKGELGDIEKVLIRRLSVQTSKPHKNNLLNICPKKYFKK
jgi:hypothetical protein